MKLTKKDILNDEELTMLEKKFILNRVGKSKEMDTFLATTKIKTVKFKPAKKRGGDDK